MSDFTTTYGDATLVLTNDQDIELGTAQLGDQFGTIKRAVIRRTGDREIIAHAKTKEILMVLIHNPGFEMQLECAFAKSVTAPGMGESLSLPLVGVTGFVMEGVTVQWEAGSERGLLIPVSSWDIMQGATAYRLTPAGELVTLGAAGLSAPSAAPTLSGSVTSSSISTAWTAVARAETYELQVSADGGATWTTLADQTAQAYNHAGLSPLATRRYRVRGVNEAGAGAWSDVLVVTTTDSAPVGVPALSGSVISTAYSLGLTWPANSLYAAEYQLQVTTDGGSTWTDLATLTSGAYTHVIGSAGTARGYRVRAANGVGATAWSSVVNLTTVNMSAPVLSGTQVSGGASLGWSSPVLAADFELQTSEDGETWEALLTTTDTSYVDVTLDAGDTRHYRVRARNAVQNSEWSNAVSVTRIVLGTPALTMSGVGRSADISVAFPPVADATGYQVEFSESSDFSTFVRISGSGSYALIVLPTTVIANIPGSVITGGSGLNETVYARGRSLSALGVGDWGSTVSVVTSPTPATDGFWSSSYNAQWTAGAGGNRYNLYLGGILIETATGTSKDLSAHSASLDAGQILTIHNLRDIDGLESPGFAFVAHS